MLERPSFFNTLFGRIATITSLITAITGFIVAMKGCEKTESNLQPDEIIVVKPQQIDTKPVETVKIKDISGKWLSQDGSYLMIVQNETDLKISEFNAFNLLVSSAKGNIKIDEVYFWGQNTALGYVINFQCNLNLSSSGNKMVGTVDIPNSGIQTSIIYEKVDE